MLLTNCSTRNGVYATTPTLGPSSKPTNIALASIVARVNRLLEFNASRHAFLDAAARLAGNDADPAGVLAGPDTTDTVEAALAGCDDAVAVAANLVLRDDDDNAAATGANVVLLDDNDDDNGGGAAAADADVAVSVALCDTFAGDEDDAAVRSAVSNR